MDEKESRLGVAAWITNLIIDTAGAEEEAAEQLETAMRMKVEELGEVEEGGKGTQKLLRALEFLTQDAEPSGTTLVDDRNGFNKLSRLAMLWTVRHRWAAGARFAFNFYRHWVQLLIRQPGEPSVKILI